MNALKTTKAFYTCKGCGTDKKEVIISARNEGQDIVEWFEGVVVQAIAEDHRTNQPKCRETKCDIGFQIDRQYGEE